MNDFPYKKIMMVGPQGSGKTTQAKILAEKLGYKYLGTGEMFREIIQKKEPGFEQLVELFEKGQLVDDQTTCELVKSTLNKPEYQDGVVIDGYPRTVAQKNIFDPGFDIILYIKVADEIAIQRLSSRGRADDTPEAIEKRLDIYHHETGPLLDIFLNEGKLWVVDGEQSVEAVTKQIFKRLGINF
ncbi:MAG: nucleoside monophosphate kinase [Candidatus Daviesbacteria bacterium]|nr:nucleoside monophosphate kinase [Candidatus Daviesbacteria bacterium]